MSAPIPTDETSEAPSANGIGHNSSASPADIEAEAPKLTVFDEFMAIVSSPDHTAAQKCIMVFARCRVDSKTKSNAIPTTRP